MTSLRRPLSVLAVAAFGAIAAGCGGGSDSSESVADTVPVADSAATATDGAEPAAEPEASTGAENAAPELLQFTSPLVGGGELDAATLAAKPTAFWFWSPT